jgi:hypothetical protein
VVAAKVAERLDRPLIALRWEPESVLRSYDEMAAGTARDALRYAARYGSKAANLGFLSHRSVLGRASDAGSPSATHGYDLTPAGFGVPLQAYREFVDHPPNADLRAKLADLIEAEQSGELSPKDRIAKVEQVQAAFLAASFPAGALEAIQAKITATMPGATKIKIRSSANAEDVPNFDGAGLHDSFAADPSKSGRPDKPCRIELDTGSDGAPDEPGGGVKRKVKPKSVACAVRAVYASLWNKRAIEERSYARIDQNSVAMGLSVVPAYDTEAEVAANAVVITRVLNTTSVYGYSVSVQQGNNLVTNPDAGTHSEVTIAGFISDTEPVSLTVTRYAQPLATSPELTAPLLAAEQMLDLVALTKRVEQSYCRAKPGYYPDCNDVTSAADKDTSLDLELKILVSGHVVVKQVREFRGR